VLYTLSIAVSRSVTIKLDCNGTDCGIIPGMPLPVIDPAFVFLTCQNETPAGTCATMNMEFGISYAFSGANFPTLIGAADGTGEIKCQLGDTITFQLEQIAPYHPFFLTFNYLPIPFFVNLFPQFILNSSQVTYTGEQGAIGAPGNPVFFSLVCDTKFQSIPNVYFVCEHHYPMAMKIVLNDTVAGGPFTLPPTFPPTGTPTSSLAPTGVPTGAPTSFSSHLSVSLFSTIMLVFCFLIQ